MRQLLNLCLFILVQNLVLVRDDIKYVSEFVDF